MIFEIENHRIPSHYDLHIKNFNSDELKFLIEYQYNQLYERADKALYAAKRQDRGRLVIS